MQLREISRLDECYRFESDTLFITGLQALVRLLPVRQHAATQSIGRHSPAFTPISRRMRTWFG